MKQINTYLFFHTIHYTLLIPSKHRTRRPKPTEYQFLNAVTTFELIQLVGYCSNHVLPDIRFLNMKFDWT